MESKMDAFNGISDNELRSFCESLGVETYGLSFEWMQDDFGGVLKWMYSNLDQSNVLSAREEYRYNEIQKNNAVLSALDVDAAIASIQEQYPGICIPGDEESKEAVKLDIQFLEERLAVLEGQEMVVKDCIQQNKLIKEDLARELTHLNSVLRVCTEDENVLADECRSLAQEIETLTEEVIHDVGNNLDVYTNCHWDKELARHFIIFSPLESYCQSTALFQSHIKLYVSKYLGSGLYSIIDKLGSTSPSKDVMEKRLKHAALQYAISKAELSGEQAKLALVSSYSVIRPNQNSHLLEETSDLEFLKLEENIEKQIFEEAVEEFVKSQMELVEGKATAIALKVKLQIQSLLSHLVDVWQRALALDNILYYSLRRELKDLEDAVNFAVDVRQFLVYESDAIVARIELVKNISSEQTACSKKLQTNNPLLNLLCKILGVPPTNNPSLLVKAYNDLQGNVKKLKLCVQDGFVKKEEALIQFISSTKPLQDYIWSGCTKQPHCWDLTVASLSRSLTYQMGNVNNKVLEAVELFVRVQKGDERNLRKLWQWFLTDPTRFMEAVKHLEF